MTEQEYMNATDLTLLRSILKMVYEINDDELRTRLREELRPIIDELSGKVIESIQVEEENEG